MVRASLFNARLAASPRRAHDSPPSAASPHSRRPPRCARSLQRSPQQRAPLDCHRHAPAFGTDPPPRPVSPRTRFAPPLRHSATRAFPPPSGRSARPPSPRRCGLRPSPASASPCSVSATLRMPLPALPATCFARVPSAPSALTSTPSRWLRRSSPASSSRCRPASLTPSVADAPSALRLPQSSRLALASPPPAASLHSCRPPCCAHRRHPAPHPRPRCGLRPSPASAPHRPRCPHHCGRHCPRFRQRASHACPQLRRH